MKKFLSPALVALVTAFVVACLPVQIVVQRALAAYGVTLYTDGTSDWHIGNGTTATQAVIFEGANPAVFGFDPTGGPILSLVSTVAALPSCSATLKGALRIVSDATTPTYNGALSGSGAVIVPVFCNGSAWVSH